MDHPCPSTKHWNRLVKGRNYAKEQAKRIKDAGSKLYKSM